MKLLYFDHGFWEVEYAGRTVRVFVASIDPGLEYLVTGKGWLDENHPLVLAIRRGEHCCRRRPSA